SSCNNHTLSLHDALPILEAFKNIGQDITPSDKKVIYVEDILAKIIFDKVLEDLNDALTIMFEVKYLYGGVDDLIKSSSRFSQERSEEHTSELQSLAYLVC